MHRDRRRARALLANAASRLAKNPEDTDTAAEVDRLRGEYQTLTLAEHIQRIVNQAPPLTAQQRADLAALLLPVSDQGAAAA